LKRNASEAVTPEPEVVEKIVEVPAPKPPQEEVETQTDIAMEYFDREIQQAEKQTERSLPK